MKKIRLFIITLVILSFVACKNHSESTADTEEELTYSEEESEAYPDGTYCAEIDYYNPSTGTRRTYTLNVEVERNQLTVIQWSNGGWLDSSHFSPEELDSNGSCSFTTYDGKQYEIQITGSECTSTDENIVSRNDYNEKQKITCPICGGKKYKYNEVCDDCKDKAEHTCKRCGQYDSFMWSSDDLCSDCKREEEEKKQQEEEEQEEQ